MIPTLDPGAEQRTLLAAERNLLASERTFLAWIRTGIACIGGGVAFERILDFQSPLHSRLAFIVGVMLILLGIGIFLAAQIEYEKEVKRFSAYGFTAKVSVGWRRIVLSTLLAISLIFLYLIST